MKRAFIKIFCFFVILTISTPLFSAGNIQYKKYKVLMNICKSMADIPCEVRNYSYMYEYAAPNEKREILQQVYALIDRINDSNYFEINFKKFKRNYIYLIVKLSKLNFHYDVKLIKDVLKEARFLNLEKEIKNYIKDRYKKGEANLTTQDFVINNQLNVGLIIPLSGELKSFGEKFLQGILTGINFFSENSKTEIFLFDENKINNMSSVLDFFSNKKINILIGPINSENQDNAVYIAKKLKIPIISVSISNKLYDYPYYYNHSLNLKDEMEQLAEYIKNENLKLGMLYPESNFGQTLKSDFINFYGVPDIILPYSSDAVDFKSQIITLGNLKKKEPKSNEYIQQRDINAIFIADGIEEALLIIPQLYFYDMSHVRIFGTNLWNSKKIFKLEKKFLKDVTFLDLIDYNSRNESFLKFKNYLNKYFNTNPEYLNTLAYDTIKIVQKCQDENINFNECVKSVDGFFLLTGKTTFDNRGISHKRFKIFRILNGNLINY